MAKKLTELVEASNVVSGDYFDVSKTNGDGTYVSRKVDYANVQSSILSDIPTTYAKLDGTNQPFTGNVNVAADLTATGIINSNTGIRINNIAGSGKFLRGNGTNFISSTLILPDSITQYAIPIANPANTLTYDSGLSYNVSTDAFAVTGTISASTGFKINAGAAGAGKFLRGNATNFVASTLVLPDTITDTYIPVATAANTIGSDAGLTYNDATDLMTVQKSLTVSGATLTTEGLTLTGKLAMTAVAGAAGGAAVGSAVAITGGAGSSSTSANGSAGGSVVLTAGAGGATTKATGGTGGNGGNAQFYGAAGGTSSGTSGTVTGGAGSAWNAQTGRGAAATATGTADGRGGTGGPLYIYSANGGNSNGVNSGSNLGGNGGSFTTGTGQGGQARFSSGTNGGGNGGTLAVATGAGGSSTAAGGTNVTGGNGGIYTLTTGNGGNGTGGSGTNTGGAAGTLTITSGTGGAGTQVGGAGGTITIAAGTGGAGATPGTNGNILFKSGSTNVIQIYNGSSPVGHLQIMQDNAKLQFGAAQDAYITFDGDSLNIKANEVGATNRVFINSPTDIGDASNATSFTTDGHQTMIGTARPWRDELSDAVALQQSGPGVQRNLTEGVVEFSILSNLSDFMYAGIQLNHDRDLDSIISPHIHWFQEEANIPNFLVQYRWQTLGETKVTDWTNLTCMSNSFAYTSGTIHQICQTVDISPPVGTNISDIIQFKILRDNANTSGVFTSSDVYTGTVGVLAFDCHFQINSLGSTDEYTK